MNPRLLPIVLSPARYASSALFDSYGPVLREALARGVGEALREDLGPQMIDPTALLAPEGAMRKAQVICRESAALCGQAWFEAAFRMIDPDARVEWLVAEGSDTVAGAPVCIVSGKARALLSAERTALNFLQTLSSTATNARALARQVEGLPVAILDTRKTLPGLRMAQKYATVCGGGANQRLGLHDGILIKENHIASCGGVAQALGAARALDSGVPIQIEVETLAQLREALDHGADSALLDNMGLDMMREAVALNKASARPALLEASGGIEGGLRAIAKTGVDRISSGAITKHTRAVDFSMRVLAS
jgi:nicotinate-nucleotide pyrophosphorylase (carboxylating)